jgi:hypothetical protein
LSAIAREFDCTPSAISYIVRKAEAVVVAPTGLTTKPTPEPVATPILNTLSLSNRSGGTSRPAAVAPETSPTVSSPPAGGGPAPGTPANGTPVGGTPVGGTPANGGPSALPGPTATPATPEPARVPAEATARPGQPPPVDATEARLRETARACLVAYRSWRQGPGEVSVQTLNDAVHDLRKVLARIEIDMSASRREEQGMRPIPVPAHRAARQR